MVEVCFTVVRNTLFVFCAIFDYCSDYTLLNFLNEKNRMKYILLFSIFILFQLNSKAYSQSITEDTIDVIQTLSLPAIKENYKILNTIILNESSYHAIFNDVDVKKLPTINFSKYKIVGAMTCQSCLSECNNKNNLKLVKNYVWDYAKYHILHSQCHNGDCKYTQYWFLVARSEYPEVEFALFPVDPEIHCWFNDNVVDSDSAYKRIFKKCGDNSLPDIDFNKYVMMARTVMGDCKARFEHAVTIDTLSKSITWKVYNIYGGCRAANSWEYWIQIPRPPAGFKYLFEEELVGW